MPYWKNFEAEIDTTDLAPVSKFAYLKELVDPKVMAGIDGLPLNTEGYERAKNILQGEYGKTSEIFNAYVQNILGLPIADSADPNKIDTFYKTLLNNVQSLETPGKIRIKADLVGGQIDCHDWDLPRLVRAIKEWRDVYPVTEESNKSSKAPMAKLPETKSSLYHTEVGNQRLCVTFTVMTQITLRTSVRVWPR